MDRETPLRHTDAATLAAFLDGGLVGAELQETVAHLRVCEECREIVGETATFLREGDDAMTGRVTPVSRSTRPWWWLAAAAAVAMIAVGIPLAIHRSDPLRALQPTASRTIQGRLTGFRYAPFQVQRGTASTTDYERLAAAAKLEEAMAHDRSAENLHRYGVAQVALGNSDEGVRLLLEAAGKAPDDASILSDLAAAQLTAGAAAEAGETAARALARDPRLAPAAFNWALALEQLSNRPAAIKAWQRYLSLDPSSPWATEAREHLSRLTAPRASWKEEDGNLADGADHATFESRTESGVLVRQEECRT